MTVVGIFGADMPTRSVVMILAFVALCIALVFAGARFTNNRPLPASPIEKQIAEQSHILSMPETQPHAHLTAFFVRAQDYVRTGNLDSAASDYKAGIALLPAHSPWLPQARGALYGVYRNKHDYVDALAVVQAAMADRKPAPTDLIIRASLYTDMGDYAHAEKDLDAAEERVPTYAPVQVARYRLFLAEGDYDRALGALNRIEQLAPYYSGVHSLRGWLYLRELDVVDAWHEFTTQGQMIQTQHQLQFIASRAQREIADVEIDPAIADCTAILNARPTAWRYRLFRGELEAWKGESDKALSDVRAVEQDQPVSPEVLGYLSDIYFESFQFAKAANEDKAAAAFSMKPAPYKRSRATSEYALEDYQDAAADFSAALALNPQDAYAVIWLHLTRLHMGVHDKDEFTKNAAALASSEWPRPVIEYMQGNLDDLALDAAANNATLSGTLRDQSCEADYYRGVLALNRDDKAKGLDEMRSAARSCKPGFVEQTMAKWALKQAG
jgi:tetratricopeptide (TPR) repeat protein